MTEYLCDVCLEVASGCCPPDENTALLERFVIGLALDAIEQQIGLPVFVETLLAKRVPVDDRVRLIDLLNKRIDQGKRAGEQLDKE